MFLIPRNLMKKLEKTELTEMKEITDEEIKIAEALKQFGDTIQYPLLDIGSGSGKISSTAFGDKEIIHLDPLEFSDTDFKLPENHSRIVGDFFEFSNQEKIKTLLFCHSLQYIDDNGIAVVNDKIQEINPEFILLVINKNDGIIGKSLDFFEGNKWHENGERHFKEFPGENYSLEEKSEITGTFFCKDINEVNHTICRLLLDTIISKEQEDKMNSFLINNGIQSTFEVNQEVLLYKNNTVNNG